tara:strand:- start:395 stop:1096 length:702 start_codon:yes stop_codon:yes gene_type:complete
MRFLCLLSILFLSSIATAIDVNDILQKVRANYSDSKSIEYYTSYALFKGHYSKTIHSEYNGYVYKYKNEIYQKINKTEFIYGKDFFLQISHSEKAVLLDGLQKNINTAVDLDQVLKKCKSKKVIENEGYYEVTLTYPDGSSSPFSHVRMRISKKKYYLTQLDLFYIRMQNFSTSYRKKDLAQSHLRITFTKTKINLKGRKKIVDFENYITILNKFLTPKGVCLGYELIDNRLK